MANAAFAFAVALSFLGIEPEEVPPKFHLNMLYSLHYRDMTGSQLSAEMYLLQEMVGAQRRERDAIERAGVGGAGLPLRPSRNPGS
jgi:hypothetical protein